MRKEDVAKIDTRALRRASNTEIHVLFETLKKHATGRSPASRNTAGYWLWWFLYGLQDYRSAVCGGKRLQGTCICPWSHMSYWGRGQLEAARKAVRQMRRAERELAQLFKRGKGRRIA